VDRLTDVLGYDGLHPDGIELEHYHKIDNMLKAGNQKANSKRALTKN
jgi:hypothetical protein